MSTSLTQNFIEKAKFIDQNYEAFKKWRIVDLLSGVFSVLGLLCALADYEYNYSTERTVDYCAERDRKTEVLRIMIAISSLLAIVLLLVQDRLKSHWKKRPDKFFVFTSEVLLVAMGHFLFPYPFIYGEFSLASSYKFINYTVCYTYSELLYCFMFFRVAVLLKAITNFTMLRNYQARIYSKDLHTRADFSFVFKVLLVEAPKFKIILVLFLGVFVIFAVTVRVFERPVDEISGLEFGSLFNSLYFIVISLATVGYGDFAPASIPGRTVMMISTLFGCIIFSIVVVSMQKNNDLSFNQKKLLQSLELTDAAALCIQRAYRIYRSKTNQKFSQKQIKNLRRAVLGFHRKKAEIAEHQRSFEKEISDMRKEINTVRKMVTLMSFQIETIYGRQISQYN